MVAALSRLTSTPGDVANYTRKLRCVVEERGGFPGSWFSTYALKLGMVRGKTNGFEPTAIRTASRAHRDRRRGFARFFVRRVGDRRILDQRGRERTANARSFPAAYL